MSPEEIGLYQDAIKIGVPAILGLFAGLIPYFIERKRVSVQQIIENEKGRKELIINFTEALSKYIGSSSTYINHSLSSKLSSTHAHREKFNEWITEAGKNMQDNQENRVKAKALIGLIGDSKIIDSMLKYDKCVSDVIQILNGSNEIHLKQDEAIKQMKISEKELLYALGNII
jgi:hypothetical protein